MSCQEKGPKTAGDCAPCGAHVRNRYFSGKLMTVADYRAEQRYMIHRRRSLSRMLHGWGIIDGFAVEIKDGVLIVGEGEALDPCGREVVACEVVAIDKPEHILWLEEGKAGPQIAKPFTPGRYLLAAHYAERRIDPVRIVDDCEAHSYDTNRVCETVVYSLCNPEPGMGPLFKLACGELDPKDGHKPAPFPTERPKVGPVDNRGRPDLCLHRAAGCGPHKFDPCHEIKLCRHGGLEVDLGAGVALAYVEFEAGDCGKLTFTAVHQIIRGCELTRIEDIGWRNWHENPHVIVDREQFVAMFIAPDSGVAQTSQSPPDPYVDTKFWVCLSGPIQIASLTIDAVSLTLILPDRTEDFGHVLRVPVAGIWVQATAEGDPPGTTRGFRLFLTRGYWQGEIAKGVKSGYDAEIQIELRVHGNRIIDWAGRPIDADAIAHHLPSGNGTPGGDFLSSWRVKPGGEPLLPRKSDEPPLASI